MPYAAEPKRSYPVVGGRRRGASHSLFAVLLLLCGGFPEGATAQERGDDPFLLSGIIVTATRTPVGRDALANPVTLLSGELLRERGIRTVADALRSVPGVTIVQAGSAGAQTSLFLRGGESDYVRVLIDGIPVNEAGGAIDFADLSTALVERIEVLRGSGSVLYGSDAAVGVVQIFTRRGRGAPVLELEGSGGIGERRYESERYGLAELQATLTGSRDALSYSVGGGRSTSAGAYPFNNDRTLHTANARFGWTPSEGSVLALSTRFSDSESHYPTDGSGNLVDTNQAFDRRLWALALDGTHRLGDRVDARLQLGFNTRTHVARDLQDDPEDLSGTYASLFEAEVDRRSADLQVNVAVPRGTLTLGGAWEESDGGSTYESDSEFGPFDALANYDRSNTAAYLQLLSEPVDGLHATLGGRMDDNEAFGRFNTYRLGVSWSGWEGGRLRGALGKAFREPTFGESYGSGFGDIGNADLHPEGIRSWEIGVEQEIGSVLLGLTWFDQRFEDLIQFTFATAGPTDPNYLNVGAAEAVGIEVTAETSRGPLSLSGSYTNLRTQVLDPGLSTSVAFVEGDPLLRRPEHSGSVVARFALEGGVIGATLQIVGERADVDYLPDFTQERVLLPGYATLDLSAEHAVPWTDGVRLLLQVENALDRDYEGILHFPAPGRIVRVGARLTLGGG